MKALRLQDEPRKQNFHDDMKQVFEPFSETVIDTSENVTKTITETSIENNKALTNLNEKLLGIMSDRGTLPSYFLFSLSRITNPEHISQFKLLNHLDSN